jgi:predicted ATPase
MTSIQRFILTGTPGAGKTSIVQCLGEQGYPTVTEAATAVIVEEQARGRARPWSDESFIDAVVVAQRRAREAVLTPGVQFHDRSPICTQALATWLGFPVSSALSAELVTIARERVFERRVFLVRHLAVFEQTAARRISPAEALEFERLHEETYAAFGYELVDVPAAPLADRVARVMTMASERRGG